MVRRSVGHRMASVCAAVVVVVASAVAMSGTGCIAEVRGVSRRQHRERHLCRAGDRGQLRDPR